MFGGREPWARFHLQAIAVPPAPTFNYYAKSIRPWPLIPPVRPSLIDAEREQALPGEHLGVLLARALKPMIPKKYCVVTPQQIAHALLRGALAGEPGVHVIESGAL